jgi:NAD(P)-dependent dehydrogenase (short-subunit alcohol dehydrogenase family)
MTQKRAFLTGAAKRIGAELVSRLVKDGYDVVLHYGSSEAEAKHLQAAIHTQGRSCTLIQGDLSKPEDIQRIIVEVHNLGPLALMIHNASLFLPDTLETVTWQGLNDHLAVNALAPLMLIQGLYQNTDHIVSILDAHTHLHHGDFLSYTLGKQLLWRLTLDLAPVMAPKTRINGIALGYTLRGVRQSEAFFTGEVNKSPLKKTASLDEIYAALMFLNNSPSVTGEIINLDGGYAAQARV